MSKVRPRESIERHEDTQPVFMMGGGGLVMERTDEPEKMADDEKPAVEEKPVVDEKLMRFTDDTSVPAPERTPKPKPTRKLTIPAATKWSQEKSIWLFKSFWVLLAYVILTACQGTWIAFYIITDIHPNPRRIINSTVASWQAYSSFMYIFGICHTILNVAIWGGLAVAALKSDLFDFGGRHSRAISLAAAWIVPIMAIFMIIMPTWGALIVGPPIQSHVYNHMCDKSGAQVVLDGRSFKEPPFIASAAKFYQRGCSRQLFTFELQQTNLSHAVLQFRTFNTDVSTLPAELVPALRTISYDFDSRRLTGSCDGVEGSCLDGSFDPNRLAMELTSNITGTVVHSRSQSQHDRWVWDQDLPSLILRAVSDDGTLGDKVLQTAVTKVKDCTSLKVCINGSGNGPVGPEVLAPLGIMLSKQASHSYICTTPKKKSTTTTTTTIYPS